MHSVPAALDIECRTGLKVVSSSRGGFSAGGQGWLSVKYCRWAPEVAFCNGQTFHRPQTYSPTPALFLHLAQRCQHSKVNNPTVDCAGILSTPGTQDGQFPEFSQFFTKFFTKAQRRLKEEANIERIVNVEQKWIRQVALSGVPA